MISSKELIYEALAFRPVPRTPHEIGFTVHAKEKLLASTEGKALYERLDNDMAWSSVIRVELGVRNKNGLYSDEFGVVWDRSVDPDIGIPRPLITPDNLDEYSWPDPTDEKRFIPLQENIKAKPDKFQVMAVDFALYERAWCLRGMEHLLMDFVENREFVGSLMDHILRFNLKLMATAFEKYPKIDAVYFGDDFGSQTGLIMGAKIWREMIKPRLARQYGFARSAGKKVFIHSCGKVQELFDDFIEIGVECFNPFQPEVMDVHHLLDEYHGRLAFHGGVSTQRLLPYGEVKEVEAEVDSLLARGRRGGYIIAPAHATPADAKVENICAMLRRILDQSIGV